MPVSGIPQLDNAGLPAVHEAANNASLSGQREASLFVGWELRLMVIAAGTGVASWRVGSAGLDVLAGLGSTAFAVALVLTLVRAARRPEDAWYQGRAAAESAKTLAWRYAVGGDPFPLALSQQNNDRRLLDRLDSIVRAMSSLELPPVGGGHGQLTEKMRRLRDSSFQERKSAYAVGRVQDQIDWYLGRAAQHGLQANRWTAAAVGANVAGIAGGLLRLFGIIEVDLLGIAAAMGGAAAAWTQLFQHRGLATSYAVAAQELGIIKARLGAIDEGEWPLFVSDAEDAISREHTMWLARHGHPALNMW